MSDSIEDIRARHLGYAREVPPRFWNQKHNDRGTLLAEVDRQREEIERITRERDEARAEVERMKKLHTPLASLPWPSRGEAKP